jgi:hypothetical protein
MSLSAWTLLANIARHQALLAYFIAHHEGVDMCPIDR